MDSSHGSVGPEYFLTAGATDRLAEPDRARRPRQLQEASMSRLAKILYLASALRAVRALPRAIDRYIDYFGDRVS
jgi:hypothetical protein